MILFWLTIAWVIERVQLKIGGQWYGGQFNGYGAIDGTVGRTAPAPMRYRVLAPWLVALAERIFPRLRAHRLTVLYEPLKIALIAAALIAVEAALGRERALLVAALLPMTILYDYWDWAGELGGLALALTGNVWLGILGSAWSAASRPETAPLVALAYGWRNGDMVGAAAVAVTSALIIAIIRRVQGNATLYCARWMWRQNWLDVRYIAHNRPAYLGEISMSILISLLTVLGICTGRAGATWPIPLALLASGWTMARAAETRVFCSCLLWVSLLI